MTGEKNKTYISERLGLNSFEQCLIFPKFIEIETVRACNAACVFCAIDNWKNVKLADVSISDELFDDVVEQLALHISEIDTVCLCRDGEPLLDRNIHEKVSSLKKIGVKNVNLSTNCQLLTDDVARSLIDAGIDEIMFSIDGVTKFVFESIRRNLNFEKVVQNVLAFIEMRNRLNPAIGVRVRMVVVDENRHEVEPWLKFWRERTAEGDKVQAREVHNWGNQLQNEDEKQVEKYAELPCIAPFNMFTIHHTGAVVMCAPDFRENHIVGDLRANSIVDIWQGEKVAAIRDKHLSGKRNDIKMCRGCNIWDRSFIS